jgi:catechol 2,3-dioxygenase-like lactoylglutathione lyase family enzyme
MFDHLSIGVADLSRSTAFYDKALTPLGISSMFVMADRGIAGYSDASGVSFWLYSKTAEQQALPTIAVPPRYHLAFKAPNRAVIDEFYRQGLAAGGQDSGAPGIRLQYHPNYYAAYLLDPDGYKIEAVCHQP